MMRLKQFKRMTDAYGADPIRWPALLRPRARALLERSPEARAILTRAKELDEALIAASAAGDALPAQAQDTEVALTRVRSAVMERIDASARPDSRGMLRRLPAGRLGIELPRRRWIGLTAAACLAVLGGLALGLAYSPTRPQQDFVTLLQPAPVHFLAN